MPRPPIAAAPGTSDWWWVFDPRQSLRARAALIVGLGTTAFILGLSAITGTLYRRTLEQQTGALFETLAFQLGDKLDRTLYERYRSLLLGARLAPLRDPAAPTAERRRVLDALQEASPDFGWLGVTDARGRITAATAGLFEGNPAVTRPWFRGAQEAPYAGQPREDPELSRQTADIIANRADTTSRFLDLAVPVLDANGDFSGVLAAHVRWTWARDIQLSVVPDLMAREQIGATLYAGREALLDSGASGWTQPPDPPSIPDNRRGRGVLIENTVDGATYLSGYARSRGFREFRGLGWLVVVRQPVSRAFRPVVALQRGIVAWGSALAAIATIAAWCLAGRHARRLRSVRAAAERIHGGDILAVLPRRHSDSELDRMCGALGELVEDLRAKQANSDKQPKGRP